MSSTNNTTDFSSQFETTTTRLGKFVLFVSLEPFALFCNTFTLYHLLTDRALRRALHHHVILVLLIVSFFTNAIEVPRILDFLRMGFVKPATIINCLIWQWCDFTLCSLNNLLMAWMSIERHLLVFHSQIFNTSKHRLLFHYLPLLALTIYIALFYAVTMFLYPCQPQPDYTSVLCGLPCFTLESTISTFDLFANNLIPMLLDVLLSIGVIIRVLYRKSVYMHQPIQWRKYRKMILHLVILSILYLVTVAPYALIPFIGLFGGLSTVVSYMQTVYFYYLFWLLAQLLPIVCFFCISEIRGKARKRMRTLLRQENTILPTTATMIQNRRANFRLSTMRGT